MELSILILLVTSVVLPLFFIATLWLPPAKDRLDWVIRVVYGATYLVFISLVGRWDWLSIYLPPVLFLAYALSAVASWRRVRSLPWRAQGSLLRQHGLTLAIATLFLALTARALSGYGHSGSEIDFTFPLSGGTYYVGQGGGNTMLNHHNSNQSQRFAVDIVALNRFGARASGLMPGDLADYEIFGRPVRSPCTGVAISVHDGMPDNRPAATDTSLPAGNHVILACGTARVLLAHFQKDSIDVDGGSIVVRGQPLGRVGNSGNSTEPHLHMHAYVGGTLDYNEGDGVPMTFDGKFLVRGSTVTLP